MKNQQSFPLKYVSRKTGLFAQRIRAWELRRRVVSPQRSDKNRRLYDDEDIERLQMLMTAVEGGHRISHVANLSQA